MKSTFLGLIAFAGLSLCSAASASELCPQFKGKWTQAYGGDHRDKLFFGKGRHSDESALTECVFDERTASEFECDGAYINSAPLLLFTDKSGQQRGFELQESMESISCGETADGKFLYQLKKTVDWMTVQYVDNSPVFTRVYFDYTHYAKKPELDM